MFVSYCEERVGAVGWVVWGVSESRVTFGRHGADCALYCYAFVVGILLPGWFKC